MQDTQFLQGGLVQIANDLIIQPLTLLAALGFLIYRASVRDVYKRQIEILRKEEFREFSESVPAEPALAARSAPALSGERAKVSLS